MKQIIKHLFGAALLVLAPVQIATADDKTDVLAVITDFFKAMESKDTDKIRNIMLPESNSLRVIDDSDSPYAVSSLDQYVNGLGSAKVLLQERIVNPDVKVNGRLGYVWAFFQLYVDGKYNNCGINLFNMVKTADGWKMASGTYSVIPEAKCADHYAETAWRDGVYIITEE